MIYKRLKRLVDTPDIGTITIAERVFKSGEKVQLSDDGIIRGASGWLVPVLNSRDIDPLALFRSPHVEQYINGLTYYCIASNDLTTYNVRDDIEEIEIGELRPASRLNLSDLIVGTTTESGR